MICVSSVEVCTCVFCQTTMIKKWYCTKRVKQTIRHIISECIQRNILQSPRFIIVYYNFLAQSKYIFDFFLKFKSKDYIIKVSDARLFLDKHMGWVFRGWSGLRCKSGMGWFLGSFETENCMERLVFNIHYSMFQKMPLVKYMCNQRQYIIASKYQT